MECTNVLPTWALIAMLVLPALLIIAGAWKLKGGVGWSDRDVVIGLPQFLHNGGYVPDGYMVEVKRIPDGTEPPPPLHFRADDK